MLNRGEEDEFTIGSLGRHGHDEGLLHLLNRHNCTGYRVICLPKRLLRKKNTEKNDILKTIE